MKKNYYLFKMNISFLNVASIILFIVLGLVFYLIYGNNSSQVLFNNLDMVILLYIPYTILHETFHSIAYVVNGANFKNITYGMHLDKGILCCLCKQNITKKNILCSLLSPFIFIGVVTLIIGIIFNIPVLVILSLLNISGCTGDFTMFYYLSKIKDFEFSEYNDPVAFGLYSSNDLSKIKMHGIDYVEKKESLERDDLKKITVSKFSIILLLFFYSTMILAMFL